jgi:hypothetical protein
MQERNSRNTGSNQRGRSTQRTSDRHPTRSTSANPNRTRTANRTSTQTASGQEVKKTNSREGLSYKKNRSPSSIKRAEAKKQAKKQAVQNGITNAVGNVSQIGKDLAIKDRKFNPILIFVAIIIVAIILLSVIFNLKGSSNSTELASSKDISAGVSFIQGLEAKDVDSIETVIKQKKKAKNIEALKNGTMSVWAQFDDSVILGDSRAVGFYYYDFLSTDRVLAEAGSTILAIDDHLEEIKKLKPSNVFLCYGLNDVSIGIWENTEEYCTSMKEQMQKIWDVCPTCTIYISSIIPATDPAFDTSSAWRDIPEFNTALQKMCDENGWPFIDNSAVVEEYKDHYQPDGIHLETVFYEPWALNMISYVMDWEESHSSGTTNNTTSTVTDSSETSSSDDTSSSSTEDDDIDDEDDDIDLDDLDE